MNVKVLKVVREVPVTPSRERKGVTGARTNRKEKKNTWMTLSVGQCSTGLGKPPGMGEEKGSDGVIGRVVAVVRV